MMARVYGRFFPRYLPGNPSVITRNMPGGNATIGSNYAYQAKPDGLTVLMTGASVLLAYITRMSAVHYDLQKMTAILGNSGNSALYYAKPGLVDKVENLPNARNIVFGYSTGAPGWIFVCAIKLLDLRPQKVILAYSGTGESRRAFVAGEINMSAEDSEVYEQVLAPFVKTGEAVVLFQSGKLNDKGDLVREWNYPMEVPTGKELYEKVYGKVPSGIVWETYKGLTAATRTNQNILLLRPDTPTAIVKAYQDAVQRMVKDPEFIQQSGSNTWETGEAFANSIKANLAMKQESIDWLRTALGEYGVKLD